MAYPPQYRDVPPPQTIIKVPRSSKQFREHETQFARSPAMAIPGIDLRDDVPPPLPPPRILPFGDHPNQPLEDMNATRRFANGPSSMASGYGSMSPCYTEDRSSMKRREAGSYASDEGYSSYPSLDRPRDPFSPNFGLHHSTYQFQSAADLHGDSMKKKLNPIRTIDRSPPHSLLTSSVNDLGRRPQHDVRHAQGASMSMQLPIHSRPPFTDSQTRRSPTFSTMSPRSTPYQHTPVEHRSPTEGSDIERSPRGRSRRNNSDDATSTQGSLIDDMEMDDSSSLKRLHIDDSYAMAGQKRRAASPASDDLGLHGIGQTDMVRRRDGACRGSPTPRLSAAAQTPSMSMSATAGRSGYYVSNVSISTSNVVASPVSHRSPGAVSPGGLSPTCTSPYNTPSTLHPSPRTTMTIRAPMHGRTASSASPRKLPELQKPGGAKFQGFFMCECCPKKPKKFDTREELSTHESEKQYECTFCGNRFKNKNEAERHQNSLHLRRHSWSCSALSGYPRAFHESTSRPGEADACGYCGEEFMRSGHGSRNGIMNGGIAVRHATDQDWEERIRHLQEVHKFRECNASKKFYRADHFRQHLKHSHAGTSGKWTNMLENACLMEEGPSSR